MPNKGKREKGGEGEGRRGGATLLSFLTVLTLAGWALSLSSFCQLLKGDLLGRHLPNGTSSLIALLCVHQRNTGTVKVSQ